MKDIEDSHGIAGGFSGTQTRTTKTRAESQKCRGVSFFCSIYKTDFLAIDIALNQCTNELLAIWEIAASSCGETSSETGEKQKKNKKQGIISHNLLFG
jgi:hypothetical protein